MDKNFKSSQLWNNIRKGKLDAFGKLYDDYIDELFSYGLKFSSDKALVQDCIHDLFLTLYKYRYNLGDTDNVKFYLMRSLKNLIFKHLKQNNKNSEFLDVQQNSFSEKTVEDKLIEDESICEQSQKLKSALMSLTKKQRKGIFLRFTENKTYEEIADMMHISVQSSRTMIYRAIKTLRKEMLLFLAWIYIM